MMEITEKETIFLESPEDVVINVHQVMPALTEEDRQSLKESVRQRGILNPILLDEEDAVVDGHNRINIWAELLGEGEGGHIAPVVAHKISGLDKYSAHEIAIETNVARRQLRPPQKRELIRNELKFLANKYEAQGYVDMQARSWPSTRLADYLGVDSKTVRDERLEAERDGSIPYAHYFELPEPDAKGRLLLHRAQLSRDQRGANDTPGLSRGRGVARDPVLIPVEVPEFGPDGSIVSTTIRMLEPEEVSDHYKSVARKAERVVKRLDKESQIKVKEQENLEKKYIEWYALRGETAEKPLIVKDQERWLELLDETTAKVHREAKDLMFNLSAFAKAMYEVNPALMAEVLRSHETGQTYIDMIAKISTWCEGVGSELENRKKNPLQAVK